MIWALFCMYISLQCLKKKIKVRREFQRKWAETEKTTLRQMEADRDRQGQH